MNLVEDNATSGMRVEKRFRITQLASDARQLAVVIDGIDDGTGQHRLAGASDSLQPADGTVRPRGVDLVEPVAAFIHADRLAFSSTKRNSTGVSATHFAAPPFRRNSASRFVTSTIFVPPLPAALLAF